MKPNLPPALWPAQADLLERRVLATEHVEHVVVTCKRHGCSVGSVRDLFDTDRRLVLGGLLSVLISDHEHLERVERRNGHQRAAGFSVQGNVDVGTVRDLLLDAHSTAPTIHAYCPEGHGLELQASLLARDLRAARVKGQPVRRRVH